MTNEMLETRFLDTDRHMDSVRGFFDYFRMPTRPPGLIFLQTILQKFAKLPYENISKIIKLNQNWDCPQNRIRLPEEVFAQHVEHRLGGTCFSLTFYLQTILAQRGFTCYPVMADMRAGRNIHCCLIVIVDQVKYLVDPGYLLTQPMEIRPGKMKIYRNEFSGIELQFDAATNWYHLYTFNKEKTTWRYRFCDRPVPPEEFLRHWQASFNWNSMHHICLTRVHKNGLLFVRETFMRETTFAGKRNFNIRKNYHQAIFEHFGIDKQVIEQAQEALGDNLLEEKKRGLWVERK